MKLKLYFLLLAFFVQLSFFGQTIDQSNPVNSSTTSGASIGQSFTAGLTGTLSKFSFGYNGVSGNNFPLSCTVSIFNGTGNTGTLLGTQSFTLTSATTYGEFEVSISTTINVTSGSAYTAYITPVDNATAIGFLSSSTDTYTGGNFYAGNTSFTFGDLYFKTYVTTTPSVSCWASISGGDHTLAIAQNGTLWAWGFNTYGQLGDGTNTNRNVPTQIGTANNWASITDGNNFHSLAIKTDGTLWAWGFNSQGQLGNGTTVNKNAPIQIGSATNWSKIVARGSRTLAIKTDGTLWAWGSNSYGELGDGTNINRNVPTQIGTATNWASITAGNNGHTLAIKTDGTLWAWGYNVYGQLGDGTSVNKNAPIQIGSATDWSIISAGISHTLSIKTDGTLWAWGYNYQGQLGDGTNVDKNAPIQIGSATDWSTISAGGYQTLSIKTDGTLWAWGRNSSGQLGDGTNVNKNAPIQIGSATDWSIISAGISHTLSIKTDGTLWAWGRNLSGELGDGTNVNKNIPTVIDCPSAVLSIDTFDISNNITVYPNPTNGNVNIAVNNLTNVSVSVYDLNGRTILNKELSANENAVDISNFQTGMYLFRIKSSEGETIKKVIKK
jgi:alpha-tubulin suppressor-like RCC1 family protein